MHLFEALGQLASVEETVVREKAVESLNKVAAQTSGQVIAEHFIPLVKASRRLARGSPRGAPDPASLRGGCSRTTVTVRPPAHFFPPPASGRGGLVLEQGLGLQPPGHRLQGRRAADPFRAAGGVPPDGAR